MFKPMPGQDWAGVRRIYGKLKGGDSYILFSFFLNRIENTVHVHNATTNPQPSSSNTMQKRPKIQPKPTKYAKEQA